VGYSLAKKKEKGRWKRERGYREGEIVRSEEGRDEIQSVLMIGGEGWVLPRIFSTSSARRRRTAKEKKGHRTHPLHKPKLPLHAQCKYPPATTLVLREGVRIIGLGAATGVGVSTEVLHVEADRIQAVFRAARMCIVDAYPAF
jgi:hypothetical protein